MSVRFFAVSIVVANSMLHAQAPAVAVVRSSLPEIVLGAADMSGGVKLAAEGEADTSGLLLGFSLAPPLESFQRTFAAEQMVFSAGGSRLLSLQVEAVAFHAAAEARKPLEFYELIDVAGLLTASVGQMGLDQVSLGSTRPIALDGIGERTLGWVFEMVTPVATFDVALLAAARGRVGISLLAVGPAGLQDADLAGLLRTMDERVRRHDVYLTDIAADSGGNGKVAADSALAAATDVALNAIPVPLPDSGGLTVTTATFSRSDGWPQYEIGVEGTGFTFPLGHSTAIDVEMTVTLHASDAQALKHVIAAQRDARALFVAFEPLDAMDLAMLGGDSSTLATMDTPRLGALSYGSSARLRGPLRFDVDAIAFARGRLSASVVVIHRPGGGDPATALALARDMLQRMRTVMPGVAESPPPAALVAAVRQVVDVEHSVDSLVKAGDFEGAFRTIAQAPLSRAPVGIAAASWDHLCRQASLNGLAGRAIPACEAAVAPDTTVVEYRDSRGLARALTDSVDGAREDFSYVVAHAAPGEYRDTRAEWLAALRAGRNPFTPEVLEQLRQN